MSQQTLQNRVLFPRTPTLVMVGGFVALLLLSLFLAMYPRQATAATNSTLNFQARLETAAGAIVPDGFYNVEFKLYNVSSAGSALWTETYYDTDGATPGNDFRIQVRNGYVTANLGSLTAFPGTINWDQDLWITMNIGDAAQTATPTWDGEMNPRLKLTGVPYAFQAGQLATFNQTTGFTSMLNLLQPTAGNQTFQIQDQGLAGTYNLCVQGSSTGCTAASGSVYYIQNQSAAPQTANFNMQSASASTATAVLQGASGQTADLLTFIDGGLAVANVYANGGINTKTGYYVNGTQVIDSAGNYVAGGSVISTSVSAGSTSGANAPGSNLTLSAGNGTGSGGSGDIILYTAPPNGGRPAIGTYSQASNGSANTMTLSHTVPAGSVNRLLLVEVMSTSTGGDVTSMTYGGTALTLAGAINQQYNNTRTEVWYMVNPPVGTANVVADLAAHRAVVITAINVTGVNQATPLGTVAAAQGSSTTASTSVTASATDTIFNAMSATQAYTSMGAGQTSIFANVLQTAYSSASYQNGANGTMTNSYAMPSADWSMVTVPIKSSSNATELNTMVERLRVTQDGLVGINTANPQYQLDVNGDINTSTQLRIGGTVMCTASGCTPAGGSNNYIRNGTVLQTANFNIQSVAAGTVGGIIQGAAGGQTADLLQFKRWDGYVFAGVKQDGTFYTPVLLANDIVTKDASSPLRLATANGQNQPISLRYNGSSDSRGLTVKGGGINGGRVMVYIGDDTNKDFLFDSGHLTQVLSSSATVGYQMKAASGQTADLLQLQNASGNVLTKFNANGDLVIGGVNSASSANAFQIQNASVSTLFNVDTSSTGNLITNPSFEINTTGWLIKGTNPIIATNTGQTAPFGATALAVTTTTGVVSGDGVYYPVALAGTTGYHLSFYVKGSGSFIVQAGHSDDGITPTVCANTGVGGDAWVRVSCSFTTGAVSGSPYIYISQFDTTGRTFYIDGVMLTATTTPSFYRDSVITLNGAINSQFLLQPGVNTTTALNVLRADNTSALQVDTLNNIVGVNAIDAIAPGTLTVGNAYATTLNIATNNAAHTIAIGTGTAVQGITIGSTNGASSLTLQAGTGNFTVTGTASATYTIGATNTTGTITLGRSTASNTINIGNGTIANGSTGTVNIGTNATGTTGKTTITIGSTNAASSTTIQGGTVGIIAKSVSTTAFQVQDSAANPVFNVDTSLIYNAVLNPNFERGTTTPYGWTAVGSPTTFSRNTNSALSYDGTSSLMLTTTATAGQGFQGLPVIGNIPANTLTYSFYAMMGSGTMASDLWQITTSDTGTHTATCDSGVTLNANGFQRMSCTVTTTGILTNFSFTQIDATARTVYIDATSLTGSSAYPYRAGGAIQMLGSISSPALFLGAANSTTAFQIQNAAGTSNLFVADTLNNRIGIGGALNVGGATTLSGDVTVAAGKYISLVGGITSTRPASPTAGMLYFDQTTGQLLTYTGTKWQADRSDNTKIVAASNSSQAAKDAADYVADGNTATAADGDQVQINQALTAAAGGKVYLLEGTYVADATIRVPDNTTLAGAGRGSLIELADLDADENLIEDDGTTGIQIQDIRLDGRKDLNTAGVQSGIYIPAHGAAGKESGKIINVTVVNFRNRGIELTNTFDFLLSNNSIRRNGQEGIYVAVGDSSMISGNIVQSNGAAGIYVSTSSYVNIINNVIGGNSGTGIYVSDRTVISGNNLISNSATGITVAGILNTVTGNQITGSSSDGILLSATDNTVTGNIIRSSSSAGINISSGSQIISGNTLSGNTSYGIRIQSNGSTVTGNTVKDSGGTTNNNGIYLSNADSNTITGNTVSDSSATTTNYAINVFSSTSDNNYLADNSLGGGSINDLGTGTKYANQIDAAGNSINKGSGSLVTRLQAGSVADLLQIQNSTGDVLAKFDKDGSLTIGRAAAATNAVLNVGVAGDVYSRFTVNADGQLNWGSGTAAPSVYLQRSASGDLRTDARFYANRLYAGGTGTTGTSTLTIMPNTATTVGFELNAATGQTADLMQIHDVNSVTVTKFDASGNLTVPTVSATTLQAPTLDTATVTGLSIGTTNSSSLVLGNNATSYSVTLHSGNGGMVNIANSAHSSTINIGAGAAAKTITLGSTNTTSSLVLQAGTGGITMNGAALLTNGSNSATAFQIQDSTTAAAFIVSTNNVIGGANAADATLKVAMDSVTGRSINAAGTINASGADFAEYFYQAAPGTLKAGMLACRADGATAAPCRASGVIIGAVSDNAGYVGNDIYDAAHPERTAVIGMLGQVRVRISDANGIIKAGDPLAASADEPGVAVLATGPGMIVGWAMEEASDAQDGRLLTLVRPQFYVPVNLAIQGTELNISGQALIGGSLNVGASLNVGGLTKLNTLVVSGNATFLGELKVHGPLAVQTITVNGHIIISGNAPLVAVGVAGGKPKVTNGITDASTEPKATVNGNDSAGTVSVKTGVIDLKDGVLAHLSFSGDFKAAHKVVITPNTSASSKLNVYVVKTTKGFDIVTDATSLAGMEYQFDYIVLGAVMTAVL